MFFQSSDDTGEKSLKSFSFSMFIVLSFMVTFIQRQSIADKPRANIHNKF